MTRKIYEEEFIAAGVEGMYELANSHPYNKIVSVVPTSENGVEREFYRDPIVYKEDFLNKIAEDDMTFSLLVGRQTFFNIIEQEAEEYNPEMIDKPLLEISEPYDIAIHFEEVDGGYAFACNYKYKVRE